MRYKPGATRFERNQFKNQAYSVDGLAMPENPEEIGGSAPYDDHFEYAPLDTERIKVSVAVSERRLGPIRLVSLNIPSSEHFNIVGGWCVTGLRRSINPRSDDDDGGSWVDASKYL